MKKNKRKITKTIYIWVYLLVSVIGVLLLVDYFNSMITKHDSELTVNIDSLIAEKMNRSIEYMQQSVNEMANVLSYQNLPELTELYDRLVDSVDESDYTGIGIVGQDGVVYGQESEQKEIAKWNLIELALRTETVSISEPYRSSMTGKLVFTMFSPIYQNGERLGCIFVTYPLAEIQNIATTDVLQDQADIYLLNSISNTAILCSGSDEYMLGNWSSTLLVKQQLDSSSTSEYSKWEEAMRNREKKGTVKFILRGVTYVQVFERIDSMDGWSVVVRIPNNALSDTMQTFRTITIVFVVVLVVLSICMIYALHMRDVAEKERFEYLSTHDALTGLYNRHVFDTSVQTHLNSMGSDERGALIFIDIDYFKSINDNFGHDVGDKTLVAFADCLTEVFSEESFIARYGGDEFVVLVKNVESNASLNTRLKTLKSRLGEIKVLEQENSKYKLHYSAGIVAFPDYGNDFSELVKYADLALYNVKERGRNGYEWFEK